MARSSKHVHGWVFAGLGIVVTTIVAAIFSVILPEGVAAQSAGAAPTGPIGTIVIAHGGGPAWDAKVIEVAGQARTGGPVEVSFLEGPAKATHAFHDAAQRLVEKGAKQIVVVPMFVSSHSGHYEEIRWLAGARDTIDEETRRHLLTGGIMPASYAGVTVPIRLAAAIDDAPEAGRVLADRSRALSQSPAQEALFIVGHGPNTSEEVAQWMRNFRSLAETVSSEVGFKFVRAGLLKDDAPDEVRAEAVQSIRETIELLHLATGKPVVVVPVLISSGEVNEQKIPVDLEGLPITYDRVPLLPHSEMARWIESRVKAAAVP